MNSLEQDKPPLAAGVYTPIGPRRRFFQWVTGAILGVIALSLAIPLTGYIISPALRRRAQPWVDVGSVDELVPGVPKQLAHVLPIQDGYLEVRAVKSVWAVRQSQKTEGITVFSPICPHLGCGYRWDDAEQKFKCPCHNSVYSITGQVLAGPAPRPLDVLPNKVEHGRLLVLYKEFKAGLPKQVEL
jgi:menaquinol-cytochrome c reductase iron-sulfur subunit